jgi:hypothetical protein
MISADPLFACKQCGQCCKGYGGTYVTWKERVAIANFLGIPRSQLEAEYCVSSGKRFMLAQADDGYCIFFKQNCSIHPVKPSMCRRWPFIEALLVDIANWRIMSASCPGMRADVDDASLLAAIGSIIHRSNL